mgnify:CR=1 FL=1
MRKIPRKVSEAHEAITQAYYDGRLIRERCSILRCMRRGEAHHDDYDKPLSIRFLCRKHHQRQHARNLSVPIDKIIDILPRSRYWIKQSEARARPIQAARLDASLSRSVKEFQAMKWFESSQICPFPKQHGDKGLPSGDTSKAERQG